MRTVQSVTPGPGTKLHLVYSDGENAVVDFQYAIAQGGVFKPLQDPDFFSQVTLGSQGRYIQWPGDLDFCVDALWLQAHASTYFEAANVEQALSAGSINQA